jgi:excisionase family DNA binding protein
MSLPVKDVFITEAELAEWLNVSKSTLHKLREDGGLPFRLISQCIRYSTLEIEEWLKGRRINTPESTLPESAEMASVIINRAELQQE